MTISHLIKTFNDELNALTGHFSEGILLTQLTYKNCAGALAGVAQVVGHHPAKQKVSGLIPTQGTCLGCRFGPQSGQVQEATNQCFPLTLMFLSPFSLPSPLS